MTVLAIADGGFAAGSPPPSAVGLPACLRGWLALALAGRTDAGSQAPVAADGGQAASAVDLEDIRASLAGDGEAFARLVYRYQQPIAAYMWRFTRDRNQWEELVQEVFVEAYFSLPTYRAKAPLMHWLRRIATRVGYRWWKSRSRERSHASLSVRESDASVDDGRGVQDARQAADVVHALLARMPPRDRLVLSLMYLEECSVEEIARHTGWSRTMVKVQAHRARKKLKILLEESEALG